jgi:hypothetical protein
MESTITQEPAMSPSQTAAQTPALTCLICRQPIRSDEAHVVTDAEYGEGEHKACVAHWFRMNYGAESLR